MIELKNTIKSVLRILIFLPLTLYFGKRSFIAFDEGFYALQARWIIEKENWVIPLWWDEYVLDRTIGVQFLIAKSQEIFGQNIFISYLPSTTSALIMLFVTYKLHEEFFGKKHAIISPLILSTTYLWFDYSHLATQDIIYSSLVTIGIYSLVKIKSNKDKLFILLFGIWIGLAFMMKTFLIAVPLLSLIPYWYTKKKLLLTKYFWIGLIIGFLPFIIWAYLINSLIDKNIILYLFEKFNILADKNSFTNPFYYYFWNIPLTFLPWSVFSFMGLIVNKKKYKNGKFILNYLPITVIVIISLFSTKTPYYPLQISAILSLNAYLGIKQLFNSRNYKFIFIFFTSRLFPLAIFIITFSYYFFFKDSLNLTSKENICIMLGLIFFASAWTFINMETSFKKLLTLLIIGPYLLTSLLLYSGLFTDRSRELRETMEYLSSLDILKNQTIKVDKSGINSNLAQSKIIRISLLTPNLGDGVKSLENLQPLDIAWSTLSQKEDHENNSFEVIYDYDILYPWKLIRKKY